MRALTTMPGTMARLELREHPEPRPEEDEAVVAVHAVSVNRGELRRVMAAGPGWVPGWDVAGEVIQAAADGSGPPVGARVVGLKREGAWAERVAVRTRWMTVLPDAITFAQAATLPVAGLTALLAIQRFGDGVALQNRRVLITGASGGVGRFAAQLASRYRAEVTGVVGAPERAEGLDALGVASIAVGIEEAQGPFDLILESVGGDSLAHALRLVAPRGLVVTYGNTAQARTTFDVFDFYPKNGACLTGFFLFDELEHIGGGTRELSTLAVKVATGELSPEINAEVSWSETGAIFDAMLARTLRGKAVLHLR